MRPSSLRGEPGPLRPLTTRLFAGLLIIGLLFLATPPADAAAPEDELEFVTLVNEYRAIHSLPPLEIDLVLMATAQEWTAVMSDRGAIFHAQDLSIHVPDGWAKLGENVGYAPAGQVQVLFEAFVASPLHRANLLDEGFDRIGVGVIEAADGRLYTTHRFMESSDTQELSAMEQAYELLTAFGGSASGGSAEPIPYQAMLGATAVQDRAAEALFAQTKPVQDRTKS